MPIWEYKIVLPRIEVNISRYKSMRAELKPEPDSIADVLNRDRPEFDSIAEVLNKYGREGWELVAIETISYGEKGEQPVAYLKRPLAEK